MPPAHRNGDLRVCGATTVVQGQSTVKVNGKLWAVKGDPNSHGSGELINTGTTVKIEGKLVIVDSHDPASADDKCIPDGPPHCTPSTAQGSSNVSAYG